MNKLLYHKILTISFVLFCVCGERLAVSDASALDLRFKVKTMNEKFYFAHNSFNNIILQKKIYEYKYEFDYDCRYKSIEKNLFLNDETFIGINDSLCADSLRQTFPFTMKEPDYMLIKFRYVADTVSISEFYDRQGNLTSYTHQFQKNNKLTSVEEFSNSGELTGRTGFWYDSHNRMINKTVFYETGYSETLYAYSQGEKLETENDYSYRYKYDLDGKIVNKKTYRGIMLVSETEYVYSNDNVVMEQEINKEGEIKKTLYEYVYDSLNNWTVCLEYNHSGNIFVKTREITYY